MPAVLFEAGSIINREEELQMNSAERLDLISASLTSAVEMFCNVVVPIDFVDSGWVFHSSPADWPLWVVRVIPRVSR